MPNLSPVEVVVVAMLALIVFGPDKLPGIARTVGRTFNDLRRMANEAKTEFRSGIDEPAPGSAPVADEPVVAGPVEEGSDEHGPKRPQ